MTATVLLAGGGTGGHVYPALAVAEALAARGEWAVEFVGTEAGLEARAVPAAGWTLHRVEAAPLPRRLSVATLRLPLLLGRAARQVARLIRDREVVAACTFGGYTSGPLALAAWWTRTPLIVQEQNAVPGLANRIAARWARAVSVSTPDTVSALPHPSRAVVTGTPVRAGFVRAGREARRGEACEAYGLDPDRVTLLVFGGSLGARRINDAVVDSAGRWHRPERLQILHASGSRDHERVATRWAEHAHAPVQVAHVAYLDKMELAYAAADVVVCRAGATSIAELTVLGLPSVLVPYPHAVADEQTANARPLVRAGAAATIADAELDGEALVAACEPWLLDEGLRARAAAAALDLGRPDAAERVAELLVEAAGGASSQNAGEVR